MQVGLAGRPPAKSKALFANAMRDDKIHWNNGLPVGWMMDSGLYRKWLEDIDALSPAQRAEVQSLLVVEAQLILGGLEAVLDRPAPSLNRNQGLDAGCGRAPGGEVGAGPACDRAPD